MAGSFETPLDIARRACQHLGERMIDSFASTDDVAAIEFNENYARFRDFEFERAIWSFATRTAILRPVDSTTELWTPPTYSAAATYSAGQVVKFAPAASLAAFPTAGARPVYWQTEQALTAAQGGNPDASFLWKKYTGPVTLQPYTADASYFTGELVDVSGTAYMSLTNSNTDAPPSSDSNSNSNSNSNTDAPPSSNWVSQGTGVAALKIFYPIGTGPSSEVGSYNVMRLPYGFMRHAPRYLWGNDWPWLGADIMNNLDDIVIEGDYLITRQQTATQIRYVAAMADVQTFHAMFCEALAARMAYEGCERVTGSPEKRKECLAAYEFFITQARLVSAILEGQPKQPQSEYITVRT